LLVDDEVTVLLTMKAVLEISGFEVDTAASAREGKSKIKLHEYQMVMTDMRMESDAAGREVIQAARTAPYHPAVALLTAYPDDDWAEMGADKMLVKPMQTAVLLRQIEKLLEAHAAKLRRLSTAAAPRPAAESKGPAKPPLHPAAEAGAKPAAKPPAKPAAKKSPKRLGSSAMAGKKATARKKVPTKKRKR
jgi:DNA-binding response OmpR family regulator